MNETETVYHYTGLHGCESKCGLRITPLTDGRVVAICSELPDNPGTSVTNFAEKLAGWSAPNIASNQSNSSGSSITSRIGDIRNPIGIW